MSAPLHFYMVPKNSIHALYCRNLFCARKQPQYRFKRQCFPASLEKLYRADLSCPPSLTRVTSAGYSWPKEVGSRGPKLRNASQIWVQMYFLTSHWGKTRAHGLSPPCARRLCSKRGVKATRAGGVVWLGSQPRSAATNGMHEPAEERQSQDHLSKQPLPARDGAPEADALLHSVNDMFVKDHQTA